jgi:putative CocE/NonD family hydrolase
MRNYFAFLRLCVSLFFCGLSLHCLAASLPAQGPDYIKANYAKTEHMVPMRDGVRLYTAIFTPKETTQKYPILLTRTQSGCEPYGSDQVPKSLGPSSLFVKEGYIFANQDIRGRWASEGKYVRSRPINPDKGPKDTDESTDTFDTIDWLVKNVPHHNGKVGHWGMSYRGWLVAAGMLSGHPALKAVSPQAPVIDTFAGDDWRHNGATYLAHAFYYAHRSGVATEKPTRLPFYPKPNFDTPDGYDFFLRAGSLADIDAKHFHGKNHLWNDLLEHPTYDATWTPRNLRPHLKNIKPALLTVGGWFDAENLFGVLEANRCFQDDKANNVLVMGPWIHGGWNFASGASLGPVEFGANTAEFYREKIELPFFNHHLKGKGKWKPPKVWSFETGTNQWREYPSWPPPERKPLAFYLRPKGRLTTQVPQDEQPSFDEYVSDPARPVPYYDKIGTTMAPEYMCADQRFASRRPEVLVYETEPLKQAITLAGPIEVKLHVSTTGADADWIIKVIDVYPNDYPDPSPNPTSVKMGGYQQLVRGEVMRGRFRNSLVMPEPFEPGKATSVSFTLPDVCHTFRPGHKIMVHVHSTWFPLVERNPQTFVDIGRARASDYQRATQRVYHTKAMASQLVAQVMQ